jgi:hypothetical protein
LMVETWFKPLNHKIYGDNKWIYMV